MYFFLSFPFKLIFFTLKSTKGLLDFNFSSLFSDCWVDNIFLKWDPVAKVYTDNDGVEVRVPHADGRYF